MLGVLITLVFCLAASVFGYVATGAGKLNDRLDPALRVGLSGIIGLGAIGFLSFFLAMIGSLRFAATALFIAMLGFGAFQVWRRRSEIIDLLRFSLPQRSEWGLLRLLLVSLVIGLVGVCAIIGLIGTLAPPDTLEWDSLAYHLAVPKLWLQADHSYYISYIHHSNFPFVFDNLYLWGLQWGGDSGAKAFVFFIALCGGPCVFGMARQVYGQRAAWWAALAYATVPVILWLSGTAYIDVPNGLCAGLGIAFAALYCQQQERSYLWLSAIMLGFATASKYTGLQTIGAVGLVLFVVGIKRRQVGSYFGSAILVGLVALVIACPWYIRNVVNTGSPVYPFFYGMLGGRDWSAEQAAQYSHEQRTFGVGINAQTGEHDYAQIGHAVLGLGYQPGRYVNPAQTFGGGTPLGAVGVTVLCALFAWAISGRIRSYELFVLGATGLSLLLWFYLSQQSRYIATLAIPLSTLLGGGVVRLRAGPWLAGVAALQAFYSIYLLGSQRTLDQVPVAFGMQSRAEYQARRVTFYNAAQAINQTVPKTGKVALYDEVFGYLLDVPYYWANPGHSNEILYSQMTDGASYVEGMRRLGFTHVYINLSPAVKSPEVAQAWFAAMGLTGPPQPMSPEFVQQHGLNGYEQKYVSLIADAVATRQLGLSQAIQSPNGAVHGILFSIRN